MKLYILSECALFGNKIKYVSSSKNKVIRAMKNAYGMDSKDCARVFQFGELTIGNPNLNSNDVFITVSIQEVETDTFINR